MVYFNYFFSDIIQAAAQDGRNLEDWNEEEPQETEMEKELKRIAEQEEAELCKAR